MEIDTDKIDETVLALLHLTPARGLEGLEELRLGQHESASREGLHLRPDWEGKIGCAE